MAAPVCRLLGSVLQRGLSQGLSRSVSGCKANGSLRQLSGLAGPIIRPELRANACLTAANQGFKPVAGCVGQGSLLKACLPWYNSSRTVVRYSLRRGRPKTVKAVVLRFFRLGCGLWIRTRAGRKKHLWRKNPAVRRRLRYHVFCNKTQSKMLDKMVTDYWKAKRYYVDDPYAPYHNRTGLEKYFPDQKKPGCPRMYP